MHINSVEAAQSENKTVPLYFFVRINYWNAMISFGKYRRIRYNCKNKNGFDYSSDIDQKRIFGIIIYGYHNKKWDNK